MDRIEMSSSLTNLLSLSDQSIEETDGLPNQMLERFREFQFQIQTAVGQKGEEFFKFALDDDDQLGPKEFLDALLEEDDSLRAEMFGDVAVHFTRLMTRQEQDEIPPVRLLIMGNVDASKSTTIAVMTDPKNQLDNGRGFAREKIMKHKHEIESGRTSMTTSYPFVYTSKTGYSRHIELVDVAGHEKYLKSTIKGATKYLPDYAMLLIEASGGMTKISKEHMMLAVSLQLTLIIVLTKVDLVQEKKVIDGTLDELKFYMKRLSSRKIVLRVVDETSMCTALYSAHNHDNGCIPVFTTSNVTGQGIELLKTYIGHLPSRIIWNNKDAKLSEGKPLFVIEQTYNVPGVGLVVGGICVSGTFATDKGVIGPFSDGRWENVRIRSLQHRRKSIDRVIPGQSAGIAIKTNLTRDEFKHGLLLSTVPLHCARIIKSRVRLYNTMSVTLTNGYAPMLECTFFRQVAKVISVESDKSDKDTNQAITCLRAGDSGRVSFRMIYRPIYVEVGMKFLIREGKIKGLGIVEALE